MTREQCVNIGVGGGSRPRQSSCSRPLQPYGPTARELSISENPLQSMQAGVRRLIQRFPRSITDLDSVTVRDESGKLWTFKTEGFLGFSPSHLREHQAFAWSVTVFYEETPDGLLANSITD